MQTYPAVIPLSRGVACMDCHNITETTGHVCQFCGSRAVFNLQQLVGHAESEARLLPHPGFEVGEGKIVSTEEVTKAALATMRKGKAKRRQQR